MDETDKPQLPWLIPSLTVADVNASVDFYQRAFGFSKAMSMEDDTGAVSYADMQYQGQTLIMLMRQGAWGCTAKPPLTTNIEPAIGLYVYCADVDVLFTQAQKAGATVITEPADMFWGDRVTQLKDIDGHHWSFATMLPGKQQMET